MWRTNAVRVPILALVIGLWGAASAWAVPNLSLGFDPDKPLNEDFTIFYDDDEMEESSVLIGNLASGITINAYAVINGGGRSTPFHSSNTDYTALLIITLPSGFVGDPNGVVNVTVSGDGAVLPPPPIWVFGTPPALGELPSDMLAPHSVLPNWYTIATFQFTEEALMVPDPQTGEIVFFDPGEAYVAMIDVTITGVDGAHFDLITLDGDGNLFDFAPFSHDATVVPVPEPASMALLSVGGFVLLGVRRRQRARKAAQ